MSGDVFVCYSFLQVMKLHTVMSISRHWFRVQLYSSVPRLIFPSTKTPIYVFVYIGEVHGPGYPAPLRPDIYHPSGWVEGAQPHKGGVQGAAPRFFFLIDDFPQFLKTNFWSLKTEFLAIGNF